MDGRSATTVMYVAAQADKRAKEHTRQLMIVGDDEASATFWAAYLHFGPQHVPSQAES
jgi:hypothetical protein